MPNDLPTNRAKKRLTVALLCGYSCALLSGQSTTAAPPSFQQAVSDYGQGKYAQALSELEAFKAAYPTNAMVHYYLALCYQGLSRLDQARSEFQWVSDHGDARLKALAQSGLQQLSHVSSSVSHPSGTGGGGTGGINQGPRAYTAPMTSSIPAGAKVKKIIEFYADW